MLYIYRNKEKNPYGTADTNVVSVKMSILEKMENSMIWAMPPQRCAVCQAVVLHRAFQDEKVKYTLTLVKNDLPPNLHDHFWQCSSPLNSPCAVVVTGGLSELYILNGPYSYSH